jgi:Sulfatase
VQRNDEYYQQRLRALQSVDELVNNTVAYLTRHNLINNTYIIYSSDNGFHISQHRLFPGKNCPYEEDINVPLIIRGPGIKANSQVGVATTHTDLAPTILRMANANIPNYLDGAPVPSVDNNPVAENFEHAQVEHWGDAGSDDEVYYPHAPGVKNTTYKALRIMGRGYDFHYSVWCSNQHELYDMKRDNDQMVNLFEKYTYQPSEPTKTPFPINRLESRLDALLLVLKSCKGQTCVKPWLALHPQSDVQSLPDAMKSKYDEFYEKKQNRVSFTSCQPGYIISAEGPQTYLQYQSTKNRMAFQLD